ncbi:MAG: 50S ribosomal protein L25/general stress protein Ctc [Paludibacteraceae bacterium]|nr:50S ribosomal protein L25/general stress protein Ctc [Paludibacteraceae bacterium]
MKTFELKGASRTATGKKEVKALRATGVIPCNLYGAGANTNFQVNVEDVRKLIYSPEIFVVNLNIDGKECKAIMKELQFHPVSDKVLHMDFLQVSDSKEIVMNVPVKLQGLAEGVRLGGKLQQEMRYLKVKGLYTNIPEFLTVNVEKLGLGKTIQVRDLSYDNLTILSGQVNVVAGVKATRASKNNG